MSLQAEAARQHVEEEAAKLADIRAAEARAAAEEAKAMRRVAEERALAETIRREEAQRASADASRRAQEEMELSEAIQRSTEEQRIIADTVFQMAQQHLALQNAERMKRLDDERATRRLVDLQIATEAARRASELKAMADVAAETRKAAEDAVSAANQQVAAEQAAAEIALAALRQAQENASLEAKRRIEAERLLALVQEQRRVAEEKARMAEEARLEEEKRVAEEARLEEEKRLAEEARLEEERRVVEEARLEEERRKAEEARLEAEKQKDDQKSIHVIAADLNEPPPPTLDDVRPQSISYLQHSYCIFVCFSLIAMRILVLRCHVVSLPTVMSTGPTELPIPLFLILFHPIRVAD